MPKLTERPFIDIIKISSICLTNMLKQYMSCWMRHLRVSHHALAKVLLPKRLQGWSECLNIYVLMPGSTVLCWVKMETQHLRKKFGSIFINAYNVHCQMGC